MEEGSTADRLKQNETALKLTVDDGAALVPKIG